MDGETKFLMVFIIVTHKKEGETRGIKQGKARRKAKTEELSKKIAVAYQH